MAEMRKDTCNIMRPKISDKLVIRNRRPHNGTSFVPSILDRLLDDDPKSAADSMDQRRVNIFLFKTAIARDLESLLNTRCVDIGDTIDAFPLAKNSVATYGIQDLSSLSLLDPAHRTQLREQIRKAIERFEPRLSRIRVSLEAAQDHERRLRFRVDAILRIHPMKPPVTFDAWLHLSSAQYKFIEQR
jgi:type VI secretion system protein ImpF